MIEIRNGESTGLLSRHQGLWHNYFPVHVCAYFDAAAAGVASVTNFFSPATNIPCYSRIEILLLATKSENLRGSWSRGFFLNVKPYI